MPRIPQYNNDVFPSASPLAEAARSAGFAGRQIGSDLRQGFNALEQGVNLVQAGFEKRKAEKEAHDEQLDINNLTVASAQVEADLAIKWSEYDKSDPNAYETFMLEEAGPAYETLAGIPTTEKGRMTFQSYRAKSYGQTYVSTAKDQAQHNGQVAVNNLEDAAKSWSQAAYAAPARRADLIANMRDYIAQIDGLTADQKHDLAANYAKQISIAAADALVSETPGAAKEIFAGGEFDDVFDGVEKGNYIEKAEQSEKVTTAADKAAKTAQFELEVQGELGEVTYDEISGRYIVPKGTLDRMNALLKKYPGASTDKFTSAYNWIDAKIRQSITETEVITDPATEAALLSAHKAGTLTKEAVDEANAQGLLSDKKHARYTRLALEPDDDSDPYKKPVAERAKALAEQISGSMEGYGGNSRATAFGKAFAADFELDMIGLWPKFHAKGGTLEQFEVYMRNAAPSYTSTKEQLNKMKDQFAPNIDPPPFEAPTEPLSLEKLDKHSANGPATQNAKAIPIRSAGSSIKALFKNGKGRMPVDVSGLSPKVVAMWEQTQGDLGYSLPVVSAFRDPAVNAAAGGAGKSTHITGKAIDVQVSSLSHAEILRLIKTAQARGFTGIGVYGDNSLHLDVGGKRAWGPSRSLPSTPQWAQAAIAEHLGFKDWDSALADFYKKRGIKHG